MVRGKLARESVLPENEGRGNSVRSFFASDIPNTYTVLYYVPAGKTFIVTDIVALAYSVGVHVKLGVASGSSLRVRAQIPTFNHNGQYSMPPHVSSFKAGIRFDSGENVSVSADHPQTFVTVSGYEF